MIEGVDVRDATHVKVDGKWQRIRSKYGIDTEGRLQKPSRGGFGVITENGVNVSMWAAQSYGKDDTE